MSPHRGILVLGIASLATASRLAALQPALDSAGRSPLSVADSLAEQRRVYDAYRLMIKEAFILRRPLRAAEFRRRFTHGLQVLPGDEWLTSLRADHQISGWPSLGSPEGHASCAASQWWCDLLFVYVNQRTGAVAAADSMLDAALRRMPPEVRCVWGDVTMLISDAEARKRYERMSCEERAAFEDRLWWLADPHHSVPGNERRADHYAREVRLRLSVQRQLAGVQGYGWGLILVREATQVFAGLDPESVKRGRPALASAEEPEADDRRQLLRLAFDQVVRANPLAAGRTRPHDGFERALRSQTVVPRRSAQPLQFVPVADAVERPLLAEPTDWQLDVEWPREVGIATVRGSFSPLDHQHAYFTRGDSARLVVVADARASEGLGRGLLRAALAVSRSPHDPPRVHRTPGGPRFELAMTVPPDSALVSLEVFALGGNWGRTRFGAAPPAPSAQRVRISDVALFDPETAGQPSLELDSIVPRMFATTRLTAGSSVGLFWEVYGLQPREQASFAVTAMREPSGGVLRDAIGLFIGGAQADAPVRVSWTDLPAGGRVVEPRTVALNLASLDPGRYILALRVVAGGEESVVTRRIEIVRPPR